MRREKSASAERKAGPSAGSTELRGDPARGTGRTYAPGARATAMELRSAERTGEGHADAIRARGRATGQRKGAEADRAEQNAAEHDRHDRLFAASPGQRLGQPPGLIEHDHGIGVLGHALAVRVAAGLAGDLLTGGLLGGGRERQRGRVDAVALAARPGAVVEHVAEVSATGAAEDLGSAHEQAVVRSQLHGLGDGRLGEAGPTGP